ncbi:TIR domain-containing protein [Pseudomonas brassicacearum]|jgi:hypothetical protein|uniref:TIR domain-containing protein n=1 Tax=Pseudomonas brassicacearum TaxID=930166 RepID=UPI003ECCFAF5
MRHCFFSFHYQPDSWRAATVRSIGTINGNEAASDNDWETIKRGGDQAIKNWIQGQMKGRTCTVVLIGQNTADRKWINYEIEQAWEKKMGLLGICIHGLKDSRGLTASKGKNPFSGYTVGSQNTPLTNIVQTYDPVGWDSKARYAYIAANIGTWIEHAVATRQRY